MGSRCVSCMLCTLPAGVFTTAGWLHSQLLRAGKGRGLPQRQNCIWRWYRCSLTRRGSIGTIWFGHQTNQACEPVDLLQLGGQGGRWPIEVAQDLAGNDDRGWWQKDCPGDPRPWQPPSQAILRGRY